MQVQATTPKTYDLYPKDLGKDLVKKRLEHREYHLGFLKRDSGGNLITFDNLDFDGRLKKYDNLAGQCSIVATQAIHFLSELFSLQKRSKASICISSVELDNFLKDLLESGHIKESDREEYLEKLRHNLTENEYRRLVGNRKDWKEANRSMKFVLNKSVASAINWICGMKRFLGKADKLKDIFDLSFLNKQFQLINTDKLFYEENDELMQEVLKVHIHTIVLNQESIKFDRVCKGLGNFIAKSRSLNALIVKAERPKLSLTDDQMDAISQGFKTNTSLIRVEFYQPKLTDKSIVQLFSAISENPKSNIHVIHIVSDQLTDASGEAARTLMKAHKHIFDMKLLTRMNSYSSTSKLQASIEIIGKENQVKSKENKPQLKRRSTFCFSKIPPRPSISETSSSSSPRSIVSPAVSPKDSPTSSSEVSTCSSPMSTVSVTSEIPPELNIKKEPRAFRKPPQLIIETGSDVVIAPPVAVFLKEHEEREREGFLSDNIQYEYDDEKDDF